MSSSTRARTAEEGVTRGSPSAVPSLGDLLAEEEHEVSVRRRRAQRKRAQDSAARTRRHSLRLAAKEDPFYVDATSKAARVKAAQLDLARAWHACGRRSCGLGCSSAPHLAGSPPPS